MTDDDKLMADALASDPRNQPSDDTPSEVTVMPSDDIPLHVQQMLSEAGEMAADRLLEMLSPVRFRKLTGSVQRAILDLAFTRAYGLPVRRSVALNVDSSKLDAVAASLASLSASLPERQSGTVIDAEPVGRKSRPN